MTDVQTGSWEEHHTLGYTNRETVNTKEERHRHKFMIIRHTVQTLVKGESSSE